MHANGMEIVSPTFMNTRALPTDELIIPPTPPVVSEPEPEDSPEEVVFDKADEAEEALLLETEYKQICDRLAALQGQLKGLPPDLKPEFEAEVAELEEKKIALEEAIIEEKAALGEEQ
jgi:hypothetical protein